MSYTQVFLVILLLFPAASASVASSIKLSFDQTRFASDDILYIEFYLLNGSEIRWADLEGSEPIRQIRLDGPIGEILVVENLPAGRYVARGYIDEDGNSELTLNSNGRPAEPFGYSLAEGRLRPSLRLRNAVFELDESAATGESRENREDKEDKEDKEGYAPEVKFRMMSRGPN